MILILSQFNYENLGIAYSDVEKKMFHFMSSSILKRKLIELDNGNSSVNFAILKYIFPTLFQKAISFSLLI